MFGHWTCTQLPCSGNCTLKGGSHISTYDEKEYTFHGNCQYLLSKDTNKKFAVVAKIVQCGMSETVTCLNSVYITIGKVYSLKLVFLLPDGITFFKTSSYFINVVTRFGLSVQVQIRPVFQIFLTVDSKFQNKTIGLCGNFNGIQADDLRTISGVVEESASAFSNSWKVQASCSDVAENYDNPCAKSVSKEHYAKHWCSLLINTTEIFAACHPYLDPASYFKYCLYDVCNSEYSEDSLCMWLSTYVRDCAHRGVLLPGWRRDVCDPKDSCPESMVFSYHPKTCNISCRSLAELDPLCNIASIPTEGCSCPEGTYMTTQEKCVPPEKCPCYNKEHSIPAGESLRVDDIMCKCIRGILDCPKKSTVSSACTPPMYYFECSADPNTVGSECQKSCKTQDMQCYSKECVPGCVCPSGLISNDEGDCIHPSKCPCVYGGTFYSTGQSIAILCNTCTCKNRTWACTNNPCPQTCTVYGNGHYLTFDGYRFDFSGDCDYILVQDFCSDDQNEGSFRIILENIICGKTEAICSLGIKIILKNTTIVLFEGRVEETKRELGSDKSYTVDLVGLYIMVQTNHGLTFMWDQKTTAVVQLSPSFQGRVCGLCGNFDERASNDYTSSWRSLEENEHMFGDSWKVMQSCYSGLRSEPCLGNPSKYAWAEKHCSIIKSKAFVSCHGKVNLIPYYDSCVSDTCSCADGGDCDCLCTAIAAYSAACRKNNICIAWRTPEICPLFCDYYNKDGECEWHYKPCGVPCMKTCRNPLGKCDNQSQQLEGCYPVCSKHRPYFDEDTKICVPTLNCTTCKSGERLCDEGSAECLCCYNGRTYRFTQEISDISDGHRCMVGLCGPNGKIIRLSYNCGTLPTMSTPTIKKDCVVLPQYEYISQGECRTQNKVLVNYCTGRCATYTRYSHESHAMTRRCSCCVETKKSNREVELHCPSGPVTLYTYVHVEECSCMKIRCYEEKVGTV
ncbi:hypothetical protein FKM82_003180 [Ascaphus truei]